MYSSSRFTLARQYALVSMVFILAGMVIIGGWVGQEIEDGVTDRTAAVTALYVDSYISPYLQELGSGSQVSEGNLAFLEGLMAETLLGQQIVSFKVWSRDGTIVYSANPDLIGQKFAISDGLARALTGEVYSEVSMLDKPEQANERAQWSSLIETYAPVRARGSGEVIGVSEFYQNPDTLRAESRSAQYRSWWLVAAVMVGVYLLLAGMVGRASNTIRSQQALLVDNVQQLQDLLSQNDQLHDRVRRAAARTTALNERYLRRISADLHDGPAQDLALALLRLESLAESWQEAAMPNADEFQTVMKAVESALAELRTISAGLRLPEIGATSLADTISRAVREYELKSSRQVELRLGALPDHAPLAVKITLFRLLKEALSNSYRHAGSKDQGVTVSVEHGELKVEISDDGGGFDPQSLTGNGHLGLAGMRERVELLGGRFEVESSPGTGTVVRATLPLSVPEADNV